MSKPTGPLIQPRFRIVLDGFGYVLLSRVGQTHGQLVPVWRNKGRPSNLTMLEELPDYLFPPIAEQTAIVEYIEKATANIDSAITAPAARSSSSASTEHASSPTW